MLGPQHQIPGDGNFLDHQAQFVTQLHPWLFPMYVLGAMLAMLGTLYGTLEVAPAVLRESFQLLDMRGRTQPQASQLRRTALLWSAVGALAVLVASFFVQYLAGASKPPGLTKLLIPANLFTGVLSCGLICLLNPWMDRALPGQLRPGWILYGLNGIAGLTFLVLGIKGYWDFGGANALGILAGTVAMGFLVAIALRTIIVGDESPEHETEGR